MEMEHLAMELVEVSATVITILAFLVTAIMAGITKLGLVVGEDSANSVKRIVVLVLSLAGVIGLNYTQFGNLQLDFAGDPVGAITSVVELVVAVWFAATGVYHSIWDSLAGAAKSVVAKFKK